VELGLEEGVEGVAPARLTAAQRDLLLEELRRGEVHRSAWDVLSAALGGSFLERFEGEDKKKVRVALQQAVYDLGRGLKEYREVRRILSDFFIHTFSLISAI
jgi:hypothetical protein